MDFKLRHSSAFDEVSGISIPQPRILPAALSDGRNGIEYEYAFWLGDMRIGGLTAVGAKVADAHGRGEWLYSIHLADGYALEAMLRLKPKIGSLDNDFTFICGLASGLLKVLQASRNNSEAQRFEISTSTDALILQGVVPPAEFATVPDGKVVLAELFVPSHRV